MSAPPSPLKPLSLTQKLAPTPDGVPKYYVELVQAGLGKIKLADPRAIRALLALMNQHAVNGGAACHWGGPSALAEIDSVLFSLIFNDKSKPWYENFHLVNDVGHGENGLYALRALWGFDHLSFQDLRKFRSLESKLTGHGEAHLNPQQVFLSNGPLGSSLGQAQGLCFADRLLGNDRTTISILSDGAAMEGEAKEAFCAIAGLANKGKMNPFVLIISDNNTKLSGRIDKDSFSMEGTFRSLGELGWDVVSLENGHDLKLCLSTLSQALETAKKNPQKPVCVWAKTIKGHGVKSTADSSSGGHGFPLKKHDPKIVDFIQEIYQGEAPKEFLDWAQELAELGKNPPPSSSGSVVKKEKIQVGVSKAMVDAQKMGLPVFSISADLAGSTGVAGFQKECPQNFIDIGVAESNMISMASGMAKLGFIPVVDTFAQFGVTKGKLPLTMGLLSDAPVVAIFSHTGFQDAADGASHQATTYLSAVSSLPHTEVIALSCSTEAYALVKEALERYPRERKNYIFFLGREDFVPTYVENPKYRWGEAQVLKTGGDALLVTSGSLVEESLEAAKLLESQGIKISVINSSFINNPDTKTIGDVLKNSSQILLTVEDHQVLGGMGSILVHKLMRLGHTFKAQSLGIDNCFGQSAYKSSDLYKKHGLDRNSQMAAIKKLLKC